MDKTINSYKKSGVNIDLGNRFVKHISKLTKSKGNSNSMLFSKNIGSDLKLFFGSSQIFQKSLNRVVNIKSKLNFYFVIVYPYLKSSTKEIYSKGKFFSKLKTNTIYENGSKKKIIYNL